MLGSFFSLGENPALADVEEPFIPCAQPYFAVLWFCAIEMTGEFGSAKRWVATPVAELRRLDMLSAVISFAFSVAADNSEEVRT